MQFDWLYGVHIYPWFIACSEIRQVNWDFCKIVSHSVLFDVAACNLFEFNIKTQGTLVREHPYVTWNVYRDLLITRDRQCFEVGPNTVMNTSCLTLNAAWIFSLKRVQSHSRYLWNSANEMNERNERNETLLVYLWLTFNAVGIDQPFLNNRLDFAGFKGCL